MSYLQQNFNNSLNLSLTTRLYQIWIGRNMLLLHYLFKQNLNKINLTGNIWVNLLTMLFFKNGLLYTLKSINKKNYLYYELNLTKSLKYWNLICANNFSDTQTTSISHTNKIDTILETQYLLPLPTLNIKLTGLYYRTVLFRFFDLLLNFFYFTNKSYTNKTFWTLPQHWYLLKYYNSYFFKIYNF